MSVCRCEACRVAAITGALRSGKETAGGIAHATGMARISLEATLRAMLRGGKVVDTTPAGSSSVRTWAAKEATR